MNTDTKIRKKRKREGVDSPSERHEEQVSTRRVRVSVCVLPSLSWTAVQAADRSSEAGRAQAAHSLL